jgi:hypothetical protein
MMVPLDEEDFESGRHDPPRPSFIGKSRKASIRSNNPGATWPGPSSRKFRALRSDDLDDGDGNKIAVFPDAILGTAAMFDLWDRVYTGLRMRDAITKWSGAKLKDKDPRVRAKHQARVQSYLDVFIDQANITPDLITTKEMIRNPDFALRFAKAMSWHEAGEAFPLTDEQWLQGHREAFLLPPPLAPPSRAEAKAVLKEHSSKYSVSGWFKNVMGFFGIGVPVTFQGFKSNVDQSNEIVAFASNMISNYGIVVFSGVCIAAMIAFNWLQSRQIEDVQAGRATPSGAEQ